MDALAQQIDPVALAQIVRQSCSDPAVALASWQVQPIAYANVSPDSRGLYRVCGAAHTQDQIVRWSLVLKILSAPQDGDRKMTRFGSDPHDFFDSVYRETPPWNVGGAQPALCALFDAYPPAGPVLDVGCGSGDLAITLAQRGLFMLGIDFIDAAITQAREKAAKLPPDVARRLEFQVADALQPTLLQRQFGSVVDSGFFHLFESDERDRFVDELARTLLPKGRYYLLAFAVEFPPPSPRQVTEDEVRARFTPGKGWRIREIQSVEFLSRIAPVPAISACIERLSAPRA